MVHLSMGVSDMKKFLINIAIFFAIVAVVDFSLGKAFQYLQARAGGRTGAEYYVCEKATEDVIIMGSSRASHHYVPEIISEKLGMSCFNAGQDGNGIILQYGRWKMISKRYVPRLVIYDINVGFDIAQSDNMTYIDRLKPFSGERIVSEYISTLFPLEKIKLFSCLYRYNYKYLELATDCFHKSNYNSGYIPLYGHIRNEIVYGKKVDKTADVDLDPVKVYYLEQLIKEAQTIGTKVVLVVSPSWDGGKYAQSVYSVVQMLAERYNIPFLMFVDSDICGNPDLFEDSSHLNDKGARTFTEVFIDQISL